MKGFTEGLQRRPGRLNIGLVPKWHKVEWKDAVFYRLGKALEGAKIKKALFINAQNQKKTMDKNRILNLFPPKIEGCTHVCEPSPSRIWRKAWTCIQYEETLIMSSERLCSRKFREMFDVSTIVYAYQVFSYVL